MPECEEYKERLPECEEYKERLPECKESICSNVECWEVGIVEEGVEFFRMEEYLQKLELKYI